MKSNTDSPNWGAQRIGQKNKRKSIIITIVILAMIVFGFGSQHIVDIGKKIAPANEAANVGSLVWAVGLICIFGLVISIMWRGIDELSRKITINASAIAGITSIVMLLTLQAAGDMFAIKNPLSTVLIATILIMLAAILIQKMIPLLHS